MLLEKIRKRIGVISDDVQRLQHSLFAMFNTDIEQYPKNFEKIAVDTALRCERIACNLRNLIFTATEMRKGDYMCEAGRTLDIDVRYRFGIFELTIPGLFPKRKLQNAGFLTEPLYFTLCRYMDEYDMPHFEECVICFSHIYNKALSERRIRDYDNIELKQVQDLLSAFVLTDDSGALCDTYNTTFLGSQDSTRITIMEKEKFPLWLARQKDRAVSIADFQLASSNA